MLSAVLHAPGPPTAFVIEEGPVPVPGPGEALVQVRACGVCYHDIAVRNGTLRGVKMPITLGHEIAGVVTAVGPDVERVAPGDRVACKQMTTCGDCRFCRSGNETLCDRFRANEGGYAELAVLPAESLVRVPDNVPLDQASILACAVGVGYHAIKRTEVGLGDSVLVTGSGGGIGLHSVELAKLAGARVIAQTSAPDKVEAIKAMGADHVVVSPDLQFAPQVIELTSGRGVEVVLENVGAKAFEAAWRSLAKAGRFAFVGATERETISLNPALIFRRGAQLFGSISTTRNELEELMDLLGDGRIHPHIGHRVCLSDVAAGHAVVEHRRQTGRVVIEVAS